MELIPLDWVAIGFWIGVVVVTFGISFIFFKKHLKFTEKTKNQLAFCLVFLALAIGRAILVYSDYFLTGLNLEAYETFQMIWKVATLFEMMGLGFLIIVSEYAVFKGKDYYVFIIGYTIVVIISIFIIQDFFLAQTVSVAAIGFAAFLPISYIYLAIKLPMARRNVIMLLIGFIIFGFGLLLISAGIVSLLGQENIHLLYLISAIVQIPGLLIMAISINRMYFTEKV
jgi:MFS family permease